MHPILALVVAALPRCFKCSSKQHLERPSSESLSVHLFAVLFAGFQMRSWAHSGQKFERKTVRN